MNEPIYYNGYVITVDPSNGFYHASPDYPYVSLNDHGHGLDNLKGQIDSVMSHYKAYRDKAIAVVTCSDEMKEKINLAVRQSITKRAAEKLDAEMKQKLNDGDGYSPAVG